MIQMTLREEEYLEIGTAEFLVGALWKGYGSIATDPAIKYLFFEAPKNNSVVDFLLYMEENVGHSVACACAVLLQTADEMPLIKQETLERMWDDNE